jgi:alpha-tubulin suppressor-like RCC1 family protein
LGLLDNIESISSPHFIPHFFKYNSDKDVKKLQKVPIHYIACGAYHSIAIDHESRIYCWGEARYGQTGDGKKSKETVPKKLSIQIDVNI